MKRRLNKLSKHFSISQQKKRNYLISFSPVVGKITQSIFSQHKVDIDIMYLCSVVFVFLLEISVFILQMKSFKDVFIYVSNSV